MERVNSAFHKRLFQGWIIAGMILGAVTGGVSPSPAAAQTPPTDGAACPPGPTPTPFHTYVHHQITAFATQTAMSQPVLSGNGNRIVFTDSPGTGDPATPNKIYTINADGTDQRKVDSYTSLCFCGSSVDISDDGSKVASTDGIQLRIANGDGSGAKSLLVSGEINALKVSSDGSKVFFRIYRDTTITGSDPSIPIESGLWVVNSDGTGLRQIVSPEQLGPLVGQDPKDYPHFVASVGPPNTGIDVSTDGSRIVFAAFDHVESGGAGQNLFAVNLDGTGLHKLLERESWLWNVAISGDGAKIGYNITPLGSNDNEVGIIGFDGSGRKALAHPLGHQTLQLSADGSKLFVGDSGYLIGTATGDVTQLAALTPGSGGQTSVLYDGLNAATMNNAGNRFAYQMSFIRCADCANQGIQIAVMDIDPSSRGEAPAITDARIDPSYVLDDNRSTATAQVHVMTANKVEAVGLNFFRNGQWDVNMRGVGYLFDDGTNGDATKGDGIFTNQNVSHAFIVIRDGNKDLDLGPRRARFQAEVRSTDGKLHATAVEYEPFAVVRTAPLPTLTQLHPNQAAQGQTLHNSAVMGSNFVGTPTITFLLNGQPDGKVTASNITLETGGYLRFDLAVAADAAPGDRVVQVGGTGGASSADKTAANTFTVAASGGGSGLSGDINGDNKITVADAILVLRKAVGLDP